MDEVTYSNIFSKNKKKMVAPALDSKAEDNSLLSDFDFKDRLFPDKIRTMFINELKLILKFNNLTEMVEALFQFQSKLEELSKKLAPEEEIPSLNPFYTHLAPLLMRTFSDYFSQKESERTSLENSALESIRVAIEEEIYLQGRKYGDSVASTFNS